MGDRQLEKERQTAIHLLRSGLPAAEVAQEMKRSLKWVYKWKQRYQQKGWEGLKSQSREARRKAHKYEEKTRQMICQIRSELEAQATGKQGVCYGGAPTIRARLRPELEQAGRVPSTATIERVLREANMTSPKQPPPEKVKYPRLRPVLPHQVQQIDIVPHFLPGGQVVACFNALDIVSRYPDGQALSRKRSLDAAGFLLNLWRQLGIATYTQMDNESCFCGGHTHPHVIGKVVRLCLLVGSQPVFIPIRHPKSNGAIERFHQDYNQHVWQRHHLDDLSVVNFHSDNFFLDYRRTHYPAALNGQTPHQVHLAHPQRALPANFAPNLKQLPVTEGHVHFIRKVEPDGAIPVLNARWSVPETPPLQGVWATLSLSATRPHALLSVFDDAPDVSSRICLVTHPFLLSQPVIPLRSEFRPASDTRPFWVQPLLHAVRRFCTMF